uniref:Uncharacterized protein n=1 Tax=Romanomermis culicivorax TaxID=13658 RepID=A0A915K1D2_ROMCU
MKSAVARDNSKGATRDVSKSNPDIKNRSDLIYSLIKLQNLQNEKHFSHIDSPMGGDARSQMISECHSS